MIVGSGSGLLVFRYPYRATPQVNTEHGGTLTFDSGGNLLSASSATGEAIYEYAPPYTGTATTIDGGQGFDFLYSTASSTTGYLAAASVHRTHRRRLPRLMTPHLSLRSDDDSTDNVVREFVPPYSGSAIRITNGVVHPVNVILDATGNLIVSNCNTSCGGSGSDTVTIYAPPYTGSPIATIDVDNPFAFALTP